jgi:hypothetical protein
MKIFKTTLSASRVSACAMLAAMSCACVTSAAIAQTPPPMRNVSPGRHPYIAQAQSYISQANRSIMAAQQANSFALNGHAENARRLLDQASAELKAAALTSNAN